MTIDYKKIIETIFKHLPNPQAIELNKWIDELRKDNDNLRIEIKELKAQIEKLTAPVGNYPQGIPSCPNCSTTGKLFYMSPIPVDFVGIENATHECSRCHFKIQSK